jgi:DNA-binding GntR family transcriptional regulator
MKLRQADLAEGLGVSITPVREALLVPELVPGQRWEIYELRLMLERELTAVALAKITSRKIKALTELQRSLVRSIASGDLPPAALGARRS